MKTTWFATSALFLALSTPSVDAVGLSQTGAPQPMDLWEFNGAINLAETETSSQAGPPPSTKAGPPPIWTKNQGGPPIMQVIETWVNAFDALFVVCERVVFN